MSTLQLEVVLDPADPTHQRLTERLEQRLDSGETLRRTDYNRWRPGPSRAPGTLAALPVVLLLAPVRCLGSLWQLPPIPAEVLVVAELLDGAACELGPGVALQAPAHGEAASRFGVFAFAPGADSPLRCLVQFAFPSLVRWRHHQNRCLLALADALIWWLRLCDQRQRLLLIGPIEGTLPLLPAPSARLVQRLESRHLWLQDSLRRRWSAWQQPSPCEWQIAIARIPSGDKPLQVLHRLASQGGDWFADPFLLAHGEDLWLFCERWQAASGKGVIDLFAVRPEGLVPYGTVLEESFHLSFPRVIHHRGSWWATVESAAAEEVRLYRAECFPTRWRLERVLLRGQPWIDPILIAAADGGWWLLVNSHNLPALPGATAPVLHLFYSPDLLLGPFEPHPCSPLLVDSTCGRNGGLLQLDGELLRVGQCTGMNNAYGETVQLRRIEVMDTLAYHEAPLQLAWQRVLKQQLRATHLHTLNNVADWLAIDYVPGD